MVDVHTNWKSMREFFPLSKRGACLPHNDANCPDTDDDHDDAEDEVLDELELS
jgi:hypothetical protein